MIGFIIRRIFQSMGVMLAVALIAFAVIRFVGDPLESIASQETRLEERLEIKQRLGLDQPVYLQFLSFLKRGLSGDFGLSYKQQEPVSRMIIERLPATLELAITSSLIALIGGGILGVYAALRPASRLSSFLMTASLIGVSLPTFLIGIGLIYLFSVELGLLPSFGRGQVVAVGSWWTTGFFNCIGLAVADPASNHLVAVSDDIAHAADPGGNAGSAAAGLYSICKSTRAIAPQHLFWTCAEEYAGACHHGCWFAIGLCHCLRNRDGNGLPVAGRWVTVHQFGASGRCASNGGISRVHFACLCDHQSHCRYSLSCC